MLMAVGTTEGGVAKVREYVEAGVTCPILYPLMDNVKPVVDAFANLQAGRLRKVIRRSTANACCRCWRTSASSGLA